MAWRNAKALLVLRSEYDRANPGREKRSDGTLGDARHRAGWESSDHNPWIRDRNGLGVVRAFDLDAGRGLHPDETADTPGDQLLAGLLRAAKNNHPALGRGSYVIYEGYIYKHSNGFRRERYGGPNQHHSHVHISVGTDPAAYDSTKPWGVAAPARTTNTATAVPDLARLKYGARNSDVVLLQRRLTHLGYDPGPLDGIYGLQTKTAVTRFQRAQGWTGRDADGLIGPVTHDRLF